MAKKLLLHYGESKNILSIEVLLNKRNKFNYLFIYKANSKYSPSEYYEEDSYLFGVYRIPAELDLNELILKKAESSIYSITPGYILTTINLFHLETAVKYIEKNYQHYLIKNKNLISKVYNSAREIHRAE